MMTKMVRPANLDGTHWMPRLSRSLTILLKPETYRVFVTHFEDIVEGGKGSAEVQGKAKNHKASQSKGAKIRNRYNQVPHLTQDTNGKVTNSQLDTTNTSQEVSPFPAGDQK